MNPRLSHWSLAAVFVTAAFLFSLVGADSGYAQTNSAKGTRNVKTVSDGAADAEALGALQLFLFDAVARKSFAVGNPNATQANGFLEAFPADIQKELLEIVMMIMNESKANANVHVTSYQAGGVTGAMGSFSPAVRARIQALTKRLTNDKSFNNPQNMQKMKAIMPQFLGPNPG